MQIQYLQKSVQTIRIPINYLELGRVILQLKTMKLYLLKLKIVSTISETFECVSISSTIDIQVIYTLSFIGGCDSVR